MILNCLRHVLHQKPMLNLQQINDTKSAYNQISDLVGNQFTDDNVSMSETLSRSV